MEVSEGLRGRNVLFINSLLRPLLKVSLTSIIVNALYVDRTQTKITISSGSHNSLKLEVNLVKH